jgi:hypothetical protein
MTPQEKAEELFNKYCYAIRTEETDSGYFTNIIYAKNCAIIAVNDIIEALFSNDEHITLKRKFFLEVKQELEKL